MYAGVSRKVARALELGTAQLEGAFALFPLFLCWAVAFASPALSTLPLTASEKLVQFGLYFKIP